MKPYISLRRSIGIAVLIMVFLMIGVYSFLIDRFFSMGMNSNNIQLMEETAAAYLKEVPVADRDRLISYHGYLISPHWQLFPDDFHLAVGPVPPRQKFIVAHGIEKKTTGPSDLYIVYQYKSGNDLYYLGRIRTRSIGFSVPAEDGGDITTILVCVGAAVSILLSGLFFLFSRQVRKPIKALEIWAGNLQPDNLDQPPPDFLYPELNLLADLVRDSLSSVRNSLDREHRFLHFASHELRSPIAVIRNNMELFSKVNKLGEAERTVQIEKLMARIDRASLNMQHLAETLLWLSRKEVEEPAKKEIALDELVCKVVEELKFLLDRKEVDLRIKTEPFSAVLPETSTQIVIHNLIRNAFQHTEKGNIIVSQKRNTVSISNPQSRGDSESSQLGFGFGLELISELTEKLGWSYSVTSNETVYDVTISFETISECF